MDNCIFCKIIAGEISCYKVYEDDNFLAFLDIKPFAKGHTMVIPKNHHRWVYDVPGFGEYWETTKKISQHILAKLNPMFITYLTMGNQVPHAHIHIIPRFENDHLMDEFDEEKRLSFSTEEFKEINAIVKL